MYGLSATPLSKGSGTEHSFLERHHFVTVDSKMDGYIDPLTAALPITIAQYMAQSANYAKLVYVREDADV